MRCFYSKRRNEGTEIESPKKKESPKKGSPKKGSPKKGSPKKVARKFGERTEDEVLQMGLPDLVKKDLDILFVRTAISINRINFDL